MGGNIYYYIFSVFVIDGYRMEGKDALVCMDGRKVKIQEKIVAIQNSFRGGAWASKHEQ